MVRRRLLVQAGILAAGLLAAYGLAGFLIAPPLLKRHLVHRLGAWFHRPVAIRSVRLNPFTLSVRIGGLVVSESGGKTPLISVEEVRADLDAASLYWGALVLRRLDIVGPHVRLVRLGARQFNISDLITEKRVKKGARFSLSKIILRGGRMDLEDRTGGPSHAFTDIRLSLPFLSTLPVEGRTDVAPAFEANVDGKPIRLEGAFRSYAGGREASVGVTLDGFNLVPVFDLFSTGSTAKLASGRLDCKGWLTFTKPDKGPSAVGFRGEASLRDFRLADLQERPLIELPHIAVDVTSADFAPPAFKLGRVTLQAPALFLREGQEVRLFLEPPGEEAPPGKPSQKTSHSPEEKSGPPTPFSCALLEVTDGAIHYEDPARKDLPPITLQGLSVSVKGLSNEPSARATVSIEARTELGETLRHSGTLTLNPLSAQGSFRMSNLHLVVLAHLLGHKLPFALGGGTAAFSTSYSLSGEKSARRFALTGLDAKLQAFQLKEKASGDMVLDLPSVSLSGARVDFSAASFSATSLETRGLQIRAKRGTDGRVNLASLLPPGRAKTPEPLQGDPSAEPPEKADGPRWDFSIQNIRAEGTGFRWEDLSGGHQVVLEGEPIDLTAKDFSNAPGHRTQVSLKASLGNGGTLSGDGSVGLEPFSASGKVRLQGIHLEELASAYRDFIFYDVEGGELDTSTDVDFQSGAEKGKLALTGLTVSVDSLRLKTRGEGRVFLEAPSLVLAGADVDVNARTFAARELTVRKGRVSVVREPDGRFNLSKLLPRAASAASAFSTTSKAKPWLLTLDSFKLDGCTASFEDLASSPPVSFLLSPVQLTAQDLSTDLKNPSRVSFTVTWNGSGTLSGRGTAGLRPVSGALAVEVKKADLTPLAPYKPEWLAASLSGCQASARGDFSFRQEPDGRFSGLFSGDAGLEGLSLLEGSSPFEILSWKSLSLRGLRAGARPGTISVREAELVEPSLRLVLAPDGKTNLGALFRFSKPAAAEAQKMKGAGLPPPPFPVKIDSFTLRGGSASLTDRTVRQTLTNKAAELDCRLSGFSTEPGARTKVEVRGLLGGGAPLRIDGSLDPVGPDLYADLKGSLEGFDASRLSPYAVRYLGRTVQKGRLSLDVTYHLEGGKLTGDNHLHLERFAWGEKAESPDAQEHSVVLATRLLADRKGSIDFHVPVSGTLADPQFHLKTVVGKAFRGFLAKAALAPFAFLGAPFGRGTEELSFAEFENGRATPTPSGLEKMRTLAKALADRPALSLEVAGRADAAADAEGLKRALLDQKLLMEKSESLRAGGGPALPLGRLSLGLSEYPVYLERLYRKSFPRTEGAAAPSQPEMERALMQALRIEDDDLIELAGARAEAARDLFLDAGTAPRQLILLNPKLKAQQGREKLPGSRVDFSLK